MKEGRTKEFQQDLEEKKSIRDSSSKNTQRKKGRTKEFHQDLEE